MTNLKFRAWKKSTNEMLPVLSMKGICTNSERLTEEEFDDLIIMQSTGLFDKNGKEIFSEDIVKIEGELYTADFYEGSFWFFNEENKPHLDISYYEVCEVVGNTFENSELLNS